MEWTPLFEYVDVFINDDYRGIYILCESVKQSKSRINVDKDNGFIIEYDAYWWNEDVYFATDFCQNLPTKWTFKHPDDKDMTDEQLEYISTYVNDMEHDIKNCGDYSKYVDITSMAKWLVGQDILSSSDGGGTNIFLAKKDNTSESLLTFPCLWDFDSGYRKKAWSNIHSLYTFYFSLLFDCPDSTFIHAYIDEWDKSGLKAVNQVAEYMDNFLEQKEYINAINEARKKTKERWSYGYNTVEYDFRWMKTRLKEQAEWLDENIHALKAIPTRNYNITCNEETELVYYDLMGRIIPQETKGLKFRSNRSH